MKKALTVMLLSLLMGAAFMTPAFAGGWGRGGERGWGPGGCDGSCASRGGNGDLDKSRQEFQDQTRELRQQLFDKKNAYHEMLDQVNPNKEEAAKLWSEIFDLQAKLRKMAADAGFSPDDLRRGEGGGRACGGPACGNGPRGCNNTPRDCDGRACGNGPRGCDTPRCCDGPRGGHGRGCNGPGGGW